MAGHGTEVSGMLERPSSSEPSFMGAKSRSGLGPGCAVSSGCSSQAGKGWWVRDPFTWRDREFLFPPWHLAAPQASGWREELQLQCTIQDSHGFFPPLSHKIPVLK